MAEVLFRRPTPADIGALEAGMRGPDRDEIIAMRGPDVRASLERAVRVSTLARAMDVDGAFILLFGVAPVSLLGRVGAPWMLATERVERCPGALMRGASLYIPIMRDLYPVLVNYVDARNTRSIRWLKRLGFTFFPPEPVGVAGLPFHRFEMRG